MRVCEFIRFKIDLFFFVNDFRLIRTVAIVERVLRESKAASMFERVLRVSESEIERGDGLFPFLSRRFFRAVFFQPPYF